MSYPRSWQRGQDGNEVLIFKSLHVWTAINLLSGNYRKEEKSKIFLDTIYVLLVGGIIMDFKWVEK